MKKCVFVLEDNQDLRELFTILLEENQYQVQSYANAATFHTAIQIYRPDLFVLDVMLPDGNGLDICALLKADTITKGIPVIMISAHTDFATLKKGCLAEGFMQKPFDIYEFLEKVDLLSN